MHTDYFVIFYLTCRGQHGVELCHSFTLLNLRTKASVFRHTYPLLFFPPSAVFIVIPSSSSSSTSSLNQRPNCECFHLGDFDTAHVCIVELTVCCRCTVSMDYSYIIVCVMFICVIFLTLTNSFIFVWLTRSVAK